MPSPPFLLAHAFGRRLGLQSFRSPLETDRILIIGPPTKLDLGLPVTRHLVDGPVQVCLSGKPTYTPDRSSVSIASLMVEILPNTMRPPIFLVDTDALLPDALSAVVDADLADEPCEVVVHALVLLELHHEVKASIVIRAGALAATTSLRDHVHIAGVDDDAYTYRVIEGHYRDDSTLGEHCYKGIL
ncbi:hypothetical protein VE04_02560 [Pseudogymnoascus sp. 24MN13]|nr:hypothetical protein VE04_02560 [Pseudogymnoascus sp. 24MN13]